MEFVSIICPVYNCEKYIEKCIQSVLNQTYENWELIIIDDGSTDGSGQVCDNYKNKYQNIKVVHQQNQGISKARNVGIELAIGKYIFFLDADDYLEEKFLQDFVNVDEKYDYVTIGYIQENLLNGEREEKAALQTILSKNKLKKEYISENKTLPLTFVWGKRYKRKIINDNKIRFEEDVLLGEDIRFNLQYLECCELMLGLNKVNIVHTFDGKSAVTKYYKDRMENIKDECQRLENFLKIGDRIYSIRYYYMQAVIAHYEKHYETGDITKKEKKERLKRVYQDRYFRDAFPYILKNGTLDMKLKALCQKLYVPGMYTYLYKIILNLYKIKNILSARRS